MFLFFFKFGMNTIHTGDSRLSSVVLNVPNFGIRMRHIYREVSLLRIDRESKKSIRNIFYAFIKIHDTYKYKYIGKKGIQKRYLITICTQ